MANNDWDDDFDSRDDEGLPKRLRAEIKRLQKENERLAEENGTLGKKVRQTSVKSILEDVGVTPQVARYVLRDLEDDAKDVTKDAVQEWLSENGSMFGITQDDSTDGGDGGAEAPKVAPQGMSAEDVSALAQMNTLAGAVDTSGNPQLSDIQQRINATSNADELTELLGLNKAHAF
jgi:hypothetical protein